MFYGENIKVLRNLYGMSRKELGNKISVTEQSIGQYENSEIFPEMTKILKLSKIFNVKSQFFLTKNFVDMVTDEKLIAYRSNDRDSRKSVREGAMQINFADAIIHYCESFFDLDTSVLLNIVDFGKKIALNSKLDRDEIIDQIANVTRKSLGTFNNKDLLFLVENAGAYVIEKELDSKTDAYSVWTRNSDGTLRSAFIVLGSNNKTAVRRIFDVAHELGHLILHSDIDFNELEKDDFRRLEHEANEFASSFLLPSSIMPGLIQTVQKKSVPEAYVPIKEEYYVSLVTIEYRAFKMGLISKDDNKRFFANRYRKHYTTFEPLDDELIIKKPGKIEALFKLVNSKIMPLEQLLDDFHIDPYFLTKVFSLPNKFVMSMISVNDDYKYKIHNLNS